jgi:hypothetical protein
MSLVENEVRETWLKSIEILYYLCLNFEVFRLDMVNILPSLIRAQLFVVLKSAVEITGRRTKLLLRGKVRFFAKKFRLGLMSLK